MRMSGSASSLANASYTSAEYLLAAQNVSALPAAGSHAPWYGPFAKPRAHASQTGISTGSQRQGPAHPVLLTTAEVKRKGGCLCFSTVSSNEGSPLAPSSICATSSEAPISDRRCSLF